MKKFKELSYHQERIWFVDHFEKGSIYEASPTYHNLPVVLKLESSIEPERWMDAVNRVIGQFEVLNSKVVTEGGTARIQCVPHERIPFVVESGYEDWPDWEYAKLWEHLVGIISQPFDLGEEVPIRAHGLKGGGGDMLFVLVTHSLFVDRGSLQRLARMMIECYYGGEHFSFEMPEFDYGDFVVWQRNLEEEAIESELDYWRYELRPPLQAIEMPTNAVRHAVHVYEQACAKRVIPADLSMQVKAFCDSHDLGEREFWMAIYCTIIFRYTGHQDLPIGWYCPYRDGATETLIGPIANLIVLRANVADGQSFLSFARSVQILFDQVEEHKDMPFDLLVSRLNPDKDMSRTALFDLLYQFEEEVRFSNSSDISWLETNAGLGKYDFNCLVSTSESGFEVFLTYNHLLFHAEMAEQILGQFETLANTVVNHAQVFLREARLLTSEEIKHLSAITPGGKNTFQPVTQKIEQWGRREPDSVALSYEGQQLTYGSLDKYSRKIAHELKRKGLKPDQLVAVCLTNPVQAILAFYGIMKAGGAYLPMDPKTPKRRLRYILADAGIHLAISDVEQRSKALFEEIDCITLSQSFLSNAVETNQWTDFPVDAQNIAYCIYTSGSTGNPKGVGVTHANLFFLLENTSELFEFGKRDVWALFHSVSFDFSVWEIFGALFHGARLIIVPEEARKDTVRFHEVIEHEQVTVLNQTPTSFYRLVEYWENQKPIPRGLNRVIFGGEALESGRLHSVVKEAPWVQLVNMYGITETTVHVSYHEVEPEENTTTSLIGKGLPGVGLFCLDSFGNIPPRGRNSEIHVGGIGVSRGYLRQPALTAERFIPCEWSERPGARVYRSGDVGRVLHDSNVEYMGRCDRQVQLRGFRIELGEIEHGIGTYEAVKDCVVADNGKQGSSHALIGYMTCREGALLEIEQLKHFLKQQLPEYMIPAKFIVVDEIPVTMNGKVDYKALSHLENLEEITSILSPEPKTKLEKLVAGIWREVLQLQQPVRLDDNFFELGGNSISAAIMINHLQDKLDFVIYVVAIFDSPTLRTFVSYLELEYGEEIQSYLMGGINEQEAITEEAAVLNSEKIELFERINVPLPIKVEVNEAKNPPALIVLSPPRSGSTLLRTMLHGHPKLFAPPELDLLVFDTLKQRENIYGERYKLWLEGAIRVVMEIENCSVEEATGFMQSCAESGMSTQDFLKWIQGRIGAQMLVEKSPSTSLEITAIQRAELFFSEPYYVHLVRHPFDTIPSFEKAKTGEVFFKKEHSFSSRELAELIWLKSHQNIVECLESIPQKRQIRIYFEDLVKRPAEVMQRLCRLIGLRYHEDMIKPYKNIEGKMADGIHKVSKMLGDHKLKSFSAISSEAADRWKKNSRVYALCAESKTMLNRLGYERRESLLDLRYQTGLEEKASGMTLLSSQKNLWYIEGLQPEVGVYNLPVALDLKGKVNVETLSRAFAEVVQRHESLRIAFFEEDGVLKQKVLPQVKTDLDFIEVAEGEMDERFKRATSIAKGILRTAFCVEDSPLFQFSLIKISSERHWFILKIHHSICDGWSMRVVARDIIEIYQQMLSGCYIPTSVSAASFLDFIKWQNSWLETGEHGSKLAYWVENLKGAKPIQLPMTVKRSAVPTYEGAFVRRQISRDKTNVLEILSRHYGGTLYMTLLSVYYILLKRVSGQSDIVIGTPVHNRTQKAFEDVVGYFANTLPLRLNLEGNPRVNDVLDATHRCVVHAFANQDIPFDTILRAVDYKVDASRNPLFQVMFSMLNLPSVDIELAELSLTGVELEGSVAKFDLTLIAEVNDEGIGLNLEYNSTLFEHRFAEQFLDGYEKLLGVIGGEINFCLSEVALFEQQSSLSQSISDIETVTVLDALYRTSDTRRDKTALTSADGSVTYQELVQRVEKMACSLWEVGVRPGSAVAVCCHKSIDSVALQGAIWKVGAIYLPLSESNPDSFNQHCVNDGGAGLVVLDEGMNENWIPAGVLKATLKNLYSISEQGSLPQIVEPFLVAYYLYTSGTSGFPKAVVVNHQAFWTHLQGMQKSIELKDTDSMLHSASMVFDVSLEQLWLPLSQGITVHLSEEILTDAELFMDTVELTQATVINVTPSFWKLIDELERGASFTASVRMLILGAEKLSSQILEKTQSKFKHIEVCNAYGPTETVITSTVFKCNNRREKYSDIVPIGMAVPGRSVYCLDRYFEDPICGGGHELFITGNCLAQGYLNRPSLTAEKFLPNKKGIGSGERMYRSGDLGCVREDGSFSYKGRVDFQIKVRGYRIELEAIESAMEQVVGITAAVVVEKCVEGETCLVGYYTSQTQVDSLWLKAELKQSLPQYMIPSILVHLDEFLMKSNGKLDRDALPEPTGHNFSQPNYVEPETNLQKALALIWSDILEVERVGLYDNFFELGGHSLKVMRMVARVRDQFNIEINFKMLFEFPSLKDFSNSVLKDGKLLKERAEVKEDSKVAEEGVL